jgi:hypothetical protein
MDSLFSRKRDYSSFVVTLPSYCVPGEEAESLLSKREAQLEWMRQNGVRHLGTPVDRPQRAASEVAVTAMRLVRLRDQRHDAADDLPEAANGR